MKQLRVILLLLLFLQSKIGVAFNVHYCGAHIANISWAFDAKGCGMEKKIPTTEELQFSQKNCCEDDLIISQNDSDQNINDQEQSNVDVLAGTFNPIFRPIVANHATVQQMGIRHPPREPLYIKHCAQIFYE
jgi:hypothetical protein